MLSTFDSALMPSFATVPFLAHSRRAWILKVVIDMYTSTDGLFLFVELPLAYWHKDVDSVSG